MTDLITNANTLHVSRHSQSISVSNHSVSDNELLVISKPNKLQNKLHNKLDLKSKSLKLLNNKSRLSDDNDDDDNDSDNKSTSPDKDITTNSNTTGSNDDDDDYLSISENELMGDLDLAADISTNIALLNKKKRSLSGSFDDKPLLIHSLSTNDMNKNKNKKNKKKQHKRKYKKRRSGNGKRLRYSDFNPDGFSEDNSVSVSVSDPDHDGNDDNNDGNVLMSDDDMYHKYVSMKRKYREQRRISKQFQEAITTIQDDNEDTLTQTELNIRNEMEKEYEMKLIKLEHQKLNNTLEIEEKMKMILLQNEHLMNENKQLQNQVASQVSTISQQQHIAVQQHRMLQRTLSGSIINSPCTPVATNLPSGSTDGRQSLVSVSFGADRRQSFGSQIVPQITPTTPLNLTSTMSADHANTHNVNTDDNNPLFMFGSASIGHDPSRKLLFNNNNNDSANDDDNLNFVNYNNRQQQQYVIDDNTTDNEIDDIVNNSFLGDIINTNNNNIINMEPSSKYKHNYKNINKTNKKRKKISDLERKLMNNDAEMKQKVGDGVTPWNRFWDLMTPSFCSCSPPNHTTKQLNE